MIQKAHEISLEAGSKMATAMKDVISAAAGLTPFSAESAKDLLNYMVRRGLMGAEEADRIVRDVEAAVDRKGATRPPPKPPVREEPRMPSSSLRPVASALQPSAYERVPLNPPAAPPKKPAVAAAPTKPAAKKASAPAKKPAVKKAAPAKKSAKKK